MKGKVEMSYKFIRAANKVEMVKVEINGKEEWAKCKPEVKAFASANFKEGDMVDFQTTKDAEGHYTITDKITKVGGSVSAPVEESKKTEAPKVEKAPFVPYNSGEYQKAKTPEESRFIRAQAIGHMTSRTLFSMSGMVDPNNIEEIIIKVYSIYDKIVK
jgi:hypothetical protein